MICVCVCFVVSTYICPNPPVYDRWRRQSTATERGRWSRTHDRGLVDGTDRIAGKIRQSFEPRKGGSGACWRTYMSVECLVLYQEISRIILEVLLL